ncbi:hypothetical protein BKA56DRAFT_663112 [Ilyonectria sp. MPI-CAGE-AT-0026]|nr:hypothetical protein BKA56DRAFT_663112 [Ilyonectria sp. MPI-CAGE-AT-0026]
MIVYDLTKEIIDAARTFPFQNPDLRHLALDPQLRYGVQNIYRKPTSDKNITDRAYLASKRRCHYGLTDSKQRSFGVREEYRISWVLFQSVLTVLRSLTPETRSIKPPGPLPYLWAVRSPVFVDFVWHNINKFTTGLKYGGHVKHFFDLSRRADLGLEWLRRYPREHTTIDQIVSWLCHICLRQMRVDVLHSIQRDLRPEVRTAILDDHVRFCRKGLSAALLNGMTAVSGNHANVKSPHEAAQALFRFNDGRMRGIRTSTSMLPVCIPLDVAIPFARRASAEDKKRQAPVVFDRYPGRNRTYDRERFFGKLVLGENPLAAGIPCTRPQYIDWSQDQWQPWVDRHIGQVLPYEAWEVRRDQENLVSSSSEKSSGIRRNPLRSTRHSVIQDSGNSHDINSSISNTCGVESEAHILTSARVVIPSQLQPESDFQLYQQVERHIISFRKQIAYGCGQAFKSQQVAMPRSIPEGMITCRAPPPTVQPRLAPRPLLPKQVPLVPESQIAPRILQLTLQIHHMTCTNQQPPRHTENRHRPAHKRGRPAKYANRQEKAAADVARRRARRRAQRQMAPDQCAEDIPRFYQVTWVEYDINYTNSRGGNQLIHEREEMSQGRGGCRAKTGEAAACGPYATRYGTCQLSQPSVSPTSPTIKCRVGECVFSGSYPSANPTDAPEPDNTDISQFLPTVDPELPEDIEEQAIFDIGTFTGAVDSVSISNHESPDPGQAITFDTALETSPQAEDDEPDPVGRLAQELAKQPVKFQGYCNDCHQAAQRNHMEDPNEQISLAMYLEFAPDLGPYVLGTETIARQKDDLAGKMSPESRREAFCCLNSRAEIPHICLDEDERVSNDAGVTFDVDSIIAFPSNLAVAKRGIRWSPTRMTVSDLQSDLHLQSIPVTHFDTNGRQHQVHRPVHQIPHYTFGRVVGFEDISLYFLFPSLYREEQKCSKLRDEDFRLWMDGILLPAIYQCYSSAHVQHYPSSYDHCRCNSTARGVETLSQRVHPVAREQQWVYYLPSEGLADVWANILTSVREPGFQQFQDVTILLQAKNLKVLTKDVTWGKMVSRFQKYWANAIDESHITTDLYFDVGKETALGRHLKLCLGAN